jgi:hypothetical protein
VQAARQRGLGKGIAMLLSKPHAYGPLGFPHERLSQEGSADVIGGVPCTPYRFWYLLSLYNIVINNHYE